jgi:outer membrane protein TolC
MRTTNRCLRRSRWLALALACAGSVAQAAPLPDLTQAQQAIAAHPLVRSAGAGAAAAGYEAEALRLGQHEFAVDGRWQQRKVDGGERFAEWEFGLSRGLRLPAKARADRSAASALERAGSEALADAHHQAALLLHQSWFDALAARAALDSATQAVTSLDQESQAVRRRQQLGDAAAIDVERAEAAAAVLRAARARAEGDWQVAQAVLREAFPGVDLAELPPLPEPVIAESELELLGAAIVEHSHERGLAQAQSDYAQARAERSRAERVADPVLGLRTLNEVDGSETALGLTFSWPIGGSHRRAAAAAASAHADRASSELAAVDLALRQLAATDVAAARAGISIWREARAASSASERQAQRSERAHALGELDLSQRLQALRQSHEARGVELQALIGAHRALARLQIDAHALWAARAGDEHALPGE